MENCIFCKIIKKEIPSLNIYEDEKTLAFLDVNPNDDGHCLVIPKKHSESFTTTDLETIYVVAKTKKLVAEILKTKLQPKGFNFATNDGKEAFQEVFHYHEHIIPKYVKSEGYAPKKQPKKLADLKDIYKKITN